MQHSGIAIASQCDELECNTEYMLCKLRLILCKRVHERLSWAAVCVTCGKAMQLAYLTLEPVDSQLSAHPARWSGDLNRHATVALVSGI